MRNQKVSRISKIHKAEVQHKNMAFQKVEDWRISSEKKHPNVATSISMVIPQAAPVFCFGRFAAGHLLERCPFFANMMVLSLKLGLLGVAKIDVNM